MTVIKVPIGSLEEVAAGIAKLTIPAGGGGVDLSSVIGLGSGATVVGTGTATGASPLQIASPAGIQAGDLVILAGITVNSIPNVTGPTGGAAWNKALRYDTSSNEWEYVYWKIADASDDAATWEITHSSGAEASLAAAVYRGVNALWDSGFNTDSNKTPGIIGHTEGLQVYVWFNMSVADDLAVVGGAVTPDVLARAGGTYTVQTYICHRDTHASFDAVAVALPTEENVYTLGWTGVFYDAA